MRTAQLALTRRGLPLKIISRIVLSGTIELGNKLRLGSWWENANANFLVRMYAKTEFPDICKTKSNCCANISSTQKQNMLILSDCKETVSDCRFCLFLHTANNADKYVNWLNCLYVTSYSQER